MRTLRNQTEAVKTHELVHAAFSSAGLIWRLFIMLHANAVSQALGVVNTDERAAVHLASDVLEYSTVNRPAL